MSTKICVSCQSDKPLSAFRRLGYGARSCRECDRLARIRRGNWSSDFYDERICKGCGNKFMFLKAQAKDPSHKGLFCSQQCRKLRVAIKCKCCLKQFMVWPCMARKRKYCSEYCAGTRLRPEQITDDVLRRTHYLSKEWRATSVAIIKRDGNECRECGTGVDLVVHHINPWLVSRDDSHENLITLCRSCHSDKHRTPLGRLAGGVSSL